jgi:hypothetical protein
MPDAFDAIAPTPAAAPAAATGDAFDQIAPDAKGDAFDQITATPAADARNHAVDPNKPVGEATPAMTAQFIQQHPVIGNVVNDAMSFDRSAAQGVNALVGTVAPNTARNLNARNDAQFPVTDTMQSQAAGIAGGAAPAVLASLTPAAPLVPVMMAAQGVGGARINAAEQRAQGNQVSGGAEALDAGGQAVLGYAMGRLFQGQAVSGVTQSVEAQLAKVMPNLIARYGARGAVDAAVNLGQNYLGNALTKGTVNPEQNLNAGAWQAAVGGGLTGLGFKAGEELGGGQGTPEQARPAAEPKTATPESAKVPAAPQNNPNDIYEQHAFEQANPKHAPGNVEGNPTRAETPEEIAQKPYDFEALRKRMAAPSHDRDNPHLTDEFGNPVAAAEPPGPGLTPEQEKAATIKPSPKEFGPKQEAVVKDLESRLNAVERRTNTQEPNEGRRESDVAIPGEHQFTAPEGAENEGLKSQLTPNQYNGIKGQQTAPGAVPSQAPSLMSKASALLGKFRGSAGKETSLDVRQALGEAEKAGHDFEAQMKPARGHLPTFDKDAAATKSWMDQVEKGQVPAGSHPAVEKAIGLLQEQRQKNAQDAIDLGIKHLDPEGEGLSRLFSFPDNQGGGTGNSVAGTNNPLKRQKYDTFSEAYDAAIAHGGKPKFDNPLDMQIARQYEVEKNLNSRRTMRNLEDDQRATWVPEGQKAPEGMIPVNDRILGTETRKESLPAQKVGQVAGMSYFDGQKFLDSQEPTYNRPGPNDMPDDTSHAFTGRKQKGTFYMAPEGAAKLNNFSEQPIQGTVAGIAQSLARGSLKLRYALSMGHSAKAAANMIGLNTASLFREGGDTGAMAARLIDAATAGQVSGSKLRRALESGTAGEIGERVMSVNPAVRLRSVVGENPAGPLKNVFTAVKDGDYAKAVGHVLSMPHDYQFGEILPNMVAAHLKGVAERQMRQGVSLEQGRTEMAAEADAVQRMIGAHIRSPEFKQTVGRSIAEIALPAERYWEGQVANLTNAIAGDKAARTATGAAFAGMIGTTAVISTALQMLMTRLNTGTAEKPKDLTDLVHPRTGIPDENGNEGRLNWGSTVADALAMYDNPVHSTLNKFNPTFESAKELYENKDREGNQIRPDDGSLLGNTGRGAWHMLKGLSSGVFTEPFKSEPAEEAPRNVLQKARDTAAQAAGVHVSHPTDSAAQQSIFDDLHNMSETGGRNLRSQDMHTSEARWAQELKDGRSRDEVGAEMREKPWMTESIAASVDKRSQAPNGIGSLVYDTQLTPWMLSRAWDKATPEEQNAMRQGLYDRMGNVQEEKTSPDEYQAWESLRDKVIKAVPSGNPD